MLQRSTPRARASATRCWCTPRRHRRRRHARPTLAPGAHALLTTAGARRFYRSAGETATQRVALRLEGDARLDWLPLETIAFGYLAEIALSFALDPAAELIGWDVVAPSLPASGLPFVRGRYRQSIELPGTWLERGTIDAEDRLLLDFAARPGRLADNGNAVLLRRIGARTHVWQAWRRLACSSFRIRPVATGVRALRRPVCGAPAAGGGGARPGTRAARRPCGAATPRPWAGDRLHGRDCRPTRAIA